MPIKRLFPLRTIITALLFGAFYSFALAVIGTLGVEYWGRPTGVAFGIFSYYYWVVLSVLGVAMPLGFRAVGIRYALAFFLGIITLLTFLFLPNQGERPILAVYAGAIGMCLVFAAWDYRRQRTINTKD